MSRYKVDQTTGDLISLEDPVALPINPSASDIDSYINGIEWIEDDNKGHYNYYIKLDGNNYLIKSIDKVPYSLCFSSDDDFTLSVTNPEWDGTLEYSTNKGSSWTTWDGSQLTGTVTQPIYLRGRGNTRIISTVSPWTFTGKYCTGNIETLLNYQTVANGRHPTMGLGCYMYMFQGCTSLTIAPELPTTTLALACYMYMFRGCTSLTTAPELPATTLIDACYEYMFQGCTSLTTIPELPATTLAPLCYQGIFSGCTSLTTPPELPATTLANQCYMEMFQNCTSLTTVSKLPATTLAKSCYLSMFQGCTSLKLSTTQDNIIYKYAYRIPTSGTGTDATYALEIMFTDTGGTFTGTPTINTTYYTDHQPV